MFATPSQILPNSSRTISLLLALSCGKVANISSCGGCGTRSWRAPLRIREYWSSSLLSTSLNVSHCQHLGSSSLTLVRSFRPRCIPFKRSYIADVSAVVSTAVHSCSSSLTRHTDAVLTIKTSRQNSVYVKQCGPKRQMSEIVVNHKYSAKCESVFANHV